MFSSLRQGFPVLLSCLLTIGSLTVFVPAESAPSPHFPSTDDLRHMKSIGGPQLSPDGRMALFTVVDATADDGKAHIWVAPVSGPEKARQLTFSPPGDKRGEHNPQWAPDGSAILFLAHRGEHSELFRLDLRGGEAAPYELKIVPVVDESKDKNAIPPAGADKKDEKKSDDKPAAKPADDKAKKEATAEQVVLEPSGFALSDDGKWLAIWAHDPETPGEKKQKDAKADASWVNHEKHGSRLYLAALKADGKIDGALKAVAIAPDVRGAVWSQAADELFVVTEPPNDLSDLGPAGSAWVVHADAPDKATKLDAIPPTVGGGAFSADGSVVVFSAATPEDAPPGYDELFALKASEPSAKPVRLTAGFAGSLNASTLFFTSDGSVITSAAVGTHAIAVRIALDGKTAPAPLDLGAPVVSGLSTNRAQTGWLWLAESGSQPDKLCYAQHLGEGCTALAIPDLAPAGLRSVEPELVQWKNEGFTIEGLLYLPPDHGAAKVPLIVDVHGGPLGAFENRNDPFAAFFVGHGWAVFRPNPRGSSNYGVKFAAANKNDLGGGDYRDIMTGVDAVLAKYPLDASKMALMGYSYGGEMAGFVEGKTDRFKAIISGAPVIDQFSEYGTERGSWYDRWYFGKPWEHLEDAWKQSPLSGAAKAKTPFLILQGQSDTTDPLGQAEEMYRALRQEGVPVELVTYPREDHGPLAIGMFGRPSIEPWHGYDARQHVIEFLNQAFGVEPAKSTGAQ
jgi:dipeptidyl aminopeptidase/acylaminoacyl peptidase